MNWYNLVILATVTKKLGLTPLSLCDFCYKVDMFVTKMLLDSALVLVYVNSIHDFIEGSSM